MKMVVFDFDGTIVDSVKLMRESVIKYASTIGFKDITPEDEDRYRNMSVKEFLKDTKIPLYMIPILLLRFKKEFAKLSKNIKIVPGMKKVIEGIKDKNVVMGILTTNSAKITKNILLENNMDYFNFVYEQKNFFLKAFSLQMIVNKYKYPKNEVIYIGDEVRDIEACRKVKILSGSVSWGLNGSRILKQYKPDYYFDEPSDILKLLSI